MPRNSVDGIICGAISVYVSGIRTKYSLAFLIICLKKHLINQKRFKLMCRTVINMNFNTIKTFDGEY